jgi:predicted metal-dependent RNase
MLIILQTYTVEFDRSGKPVRGHIVGRMRGSPERFIANHGDESTLQQLASGTKEPIGRVGIVQPAEDGRNLFTFEDNVKL